MAKLTEQEYFDMELNPQNIGNVDYSKMGIKRRIGTVKNFIDMAIMTSDKISFHRYAEHLNELIELESFIYSES